MTTVLAAVGGVLLFLLKVLGILLLVVLALMVLLCSSRSVRMSAGSRTP